MSDWTSWKYYSITRDGKMECDICGCKTNNEIEMMKIHSLLDQKIDENKIDEISRSNLFQQHFTEEEKYYPKCKIYDQVIYGAHKDYSLKNHLMEKHPLV